MGMPFFDVTLPTRCRYFPHWPHCHNIMDKEVVMNLLNLRAFAVMSVFCLGLALFSQAGAFGGDNTELKEQMQKRLDSMGKLLSGLAVDNWYNIEKGTQGLIETCEAIDWSGPGKELFKKRDDAFRSAAEMLMKQVNKKDLADTQRAFIQVTIACWGCHDLPPE
ncbi:MAG: cytochrome c [Planctomycetes bacterium]|nr:cytochrome c [Planctomycetota bacterium]